MPSSRHNKNSATGPSLFAVLALAGLVSGGCASFSRDPASAQVPPTTENIYVSWDPMPDTIRRVALLPLMTDESRPDSLDGCAMLEPVLGAELAKTERFEVVRVSPEEMAVQTGRRGWTGAELLPGRLYAALREAYGCDAILFCQLTAYRPHAPVLIGWKMKLVNLHDGDVLWAGDVIYDAGHADVQRSARNYAWTHQRFPDNATGKWAVLNSPRLFGQYTLARLLETLPER